MNQSEKEALFRYTSSSLIARNTLWSLLGQTVPWIIAIVAIPFLVSGYGVEKFGLLTIYWIVIGYFSLFDLGLSRALTKLVAEKLGADDDAGIVAIVWTALALMLAVGMASAVLVASLTPFLVQDVLNIPPELQDENIEAFYLLAISIPLIITSSGLRGLLEALQRFGLVNAIRIPLGIFSFLAPLAILPFTTNLVPVVLVLIAGRLVAWLAHLLICFKVMPALRRRFIFSRSVLKPLFRLGSWMTISNVVGPLMVYVDRFLIGSMISMAAVAYYATPSEVVTKFLIIPGAMVAVLFPAFAACQVHDPERAARLFDRGANLTFLFLFPMTLIVVTMARSGLDLWLGPDFAETSTLVLQLMAAGVFLNGIAQIPFALVQSMGRPDLPARLHLIELPFYLAGAWLLIGAFGIEGAALAWFLRVSIDMAILFIFSRYTLPSCKKYLNRFTPVVGAAISLFIVGALVQDLVLKCIFLALVFILFVPLAWMYILTQRERDMVRNHARAIPIFNW